MPHGSDLGAAILIVGYMKYEKRLGYIIREERDDGVSLWIERRHKRRK